MSILSKIAIFAFLGAFLAFTGYLFYLAPCAEVARYWAIVEMPGRCMPGPDLMPDGVPYRNDMQKYGLYQQP